MDTGKRKRIALAAGLFFLTLLAGLFLTERAARQAYENTAGQMESLTRQAPEEEAVFAGILTGKTVEDRGDAVKAGMELLEKYGYELKDSFGAGALPGMAGGMALILAAGLAACAGLAWHSMRLKREARERADYLEEKLKEETVRNQKMEAELRREEQETKSLITDISHQLKTPVASLKMSYEIEDSTELSAEETEEFRRKEREDVERLEHLLQAFTQMSKRHDPAEAGEGGCESDPGKGSGRRICKSSR